MYNHIVVLVLLATIATPALASWANNQEPISNITALISTDEDADQEFFRFKKCVQFKGFEVDSCNFYGEISITTVSIPLVFTRFGPKALGLGLARDTATTQKHAARRMRESTASNGGKGSNVLQATEGGAQMPN
eukprot:jgi/Bigna1/146546/aug1.116_g21254